MLKTKLNKPNPTSKLIVRKELIDKLESGKEKKLTFVSAPAGYGKSTVISQWIDNCCLPYSWYSLDKSDNEINNFLHYTIAGIQTVYKDIGAEALKLLESNSSPSFETIATPLINDIYEVQEHFYMVFDDYHLIENQQINQLVTYLLNNLPDNIHIVLITRSDPSIPLARLRSQQLITDIRLSDLCFNSNHVYDFFKKSLNINLTIEDAKNLESKTEGWIAGLQLTALSLQGKDDISEFVQKLKGDNRYIVDYLIEEVLQQQSPELREFLLCTSILNQFNASLCNFMLGINNGQEIIEHFERNNMFIIPLDNERNWFRYHHLFANLLQHQLNLQLKDRIPELHANASQWFESNGQLVFALDHALAAGNKHEALNHFANVIDHLWKSSRYQTILQFGGMFTKEELIKNVNLCLNYFWILFQSGHIEQAESLIYLLKNHTTDEAELAMIYVCINNLKVLTGEIESVYTYSELELQHIKENVDYWNILAFLALGEAHRHKFELTKSYQSFDKAASRAAASQLIYFEMVNRIRSSFVLWTLGDYLGAYKESKDLLDKLNTTGSNNSFSNDLLSSILYCKVGNFLVHINQIEEGLEKSVRGYELSKKSTNQLFLTSCTYLLAEAYYLAGEYYKAINIVEELDAIPYKQVAKYLCDLADSLKCKLYLLTNNHDKLKPLFEKNIEADKRHAFEYILYTISRVRYHIEQGKILETIEMLKEVAEELKAEKGYGLLAEAEILQAKAHSLIHQQDEAIDYLLHAVLRTQSAGLIRIYINEGAEIEGLLKKVKQIVSTKSNPRFNKVDIEYINSLLRVFEKEKKVPAITSTDTLSSRELDTLKLIAENLTNQEIADALYISITTVKTHVRNILLKLEAKNRNESVVIAKEKGLLH
ncbi:LuxR C-terminal-related transcriptional regulator [Maribellus sediminis]|uniref:LuxR C-terminal-related transcriptional regulator n=1 Tax=Maribellus sediminis TaxID=2696285 RepID=UPI001430A549|nr:LuxR C-terminal-related transcriptional regulator [Maribellus sediminis]